MSFNVERLVRFIDGKAGKILCAGFLPRHSAKGNKLFLISPPFAEEMNKSRYVLSRLVSTLAAAGYGALLLDFYGTGDSEGEFEDATLDIWRADIEAAADQFGSGFELGLIGLRSGALIAADVAQQRRLDSLMLIQPQAEGRQQLAQMLRLRVAAAMFGDGQAETVSDLRARLMDGQSLEVAGYRLSSQLAADMESLSLSAMRPKTTSAVNWIEVAPQVERGLTPVSRKVITAWNEADIDVEEAIVECDQFWATQEIATCPGLAEAATKMVMG